MKSATNWCYKQSSPFALPLGGVNELIAQATESAGFASLFSFFEQHHRLLGSHAPVALSAANRYLRQKFGASANSDEPIYQKIHNALEDSFRNNDTIVRPWLEQEIVACFPGNLRFACDLYGAFARKTSLAGEIRQVIRRETEAHFGHQPAQRFAEGFDPEYPWTFYHLLFAYGDEPTDVLVARGEDWQFLVPIILEGLKIAADIMMPAVLFAFSEARPGSGRPITHVELKEPLIAGFFGEERQAFLRLAASYSPRADLTASWSDRLKLSVAAAQKQL